MRETALPRETMLDWRFEILDIASAPDLAAAVRRMAVGVGAARCVKCQRREA